MNKSESKYFHTASLMDQALLLLLEKKDLEFITVKEICKKAGVNRSTFYLHYENVYELLEEAAERLHQEFLQSFPRSEIRFATKEEAFLITDEFVLPYLHFVKKNKRVLKVIREKPQLFNVHAAYRTLYETVFYPALEPFNVPEEEKVYVLEYFTQGVVAIIHKWTESDCETDPKEILRIIRQCINRNH